MVTAPSLPYEALSQLVHSTDLAALEAKLRAFNIFRVLGAENDELRHSNMLAWLLDPRESHGLGDAFLRQWLTAVDPKQREWSPCDVSVLREWNQIDILIRLSNGAKRWAVAIENKLESSPHSNQLVRYRELLERLEPHSQRVFVLLTRRREEAQDKGWTHSSYEQVAGLLEAILKESTSIAPGPRLVLEHYLDLIKKHFMEDDDLLELARKIYAEHRTAFDFIMANREDRLGLLSEAIQSRMKGVDRRTSSRQFVRFVPTEWQHHQRNNAGRAWGPNGGFILCELQLMTQTPTLKIVGGGVPEPVRTRFFEALSRNPSLVEGGRPKLPAQWMVLFSRKVVSLDPQASIDEQANQVWEGCERLLVDPELELTKALEIYTPLLDELPLPSVRPTSKSAIFEERELRRE